MTRWKHLRIALMGSVVGLVLLQSGLEAERKAEHKGGNKEAAEGPAAFEKWRNRPKEAFSKGQENFEFAKKEILKHYVDEGLREEDLYRAAVAGMLSQLDPEGADWNKLMSPTEYTELFAELNGKVVGVGIEIRFSDKSGYAEVQRVISGTPAEDAGIQAGDQILRIDGKSFKGLQLRDMIYAIRGKEDTDVRLSILQDAQVKDLTLRREALVWESVESRELEKGLGLIRIRSFVEDTPQKLKEAIEGMNAKGLKGLVIDLRGNEGGLFEQSVDSAELFLPEASVIVKVKQRGKAVEDMKAKGKPLIHGIPLAVLIDESTRSGAEIMAAALKMSGGATSIGAKTFGKWSAQQIEELPNKYAMKYTVSTFLAPDGKDLSGVGLVPDIQIAQPDEKMDGASDQDSNADAALDAAVRILKLKAS